MNKCKGRCMVFTEILLDEKCLQSPTGLLFIYSSVLSVMIFANNFSVTFPNNLICDKCLCMENSQRQTCKSEQNMKLRTAARRIQGGGQIYPSIPPGRTDPSPLHPFFKASKDHQLTFPPPPLLSVCPCPASFLTLPP